MDRCRYIWNFDFNRLISNTLIKLSGYLIITCISLIGNLCSGQSKYSKPIQFDALDKEGESVRVTLNYEYANKEPGEEKCPYTSIDELHHRHVIPVIRSYFRHELGKMKKGEIDKLVNYPSSHWIKEINQVLKRQFILNGKEQICDSSDIIRIKVIKAFYQKD